MSDIIKRSEWNRQFKSHNKINKRLITDIETTERNVNNKEQIIIQEIRQETNITLTVSFVIESILFIRSSFLLSSLSLSPSSSVDVKNVLDTPSLEFVVLVVVIVTISVTTI